jgi:hypothetical protein
MNVPPPTVAAIAAWTRSDVLGKASQLHGSDPNASAGAKLVAGLRDLSPTVLPESWI